MSRSVQLDKRSEADLENVPIIRGIAIILVNAADNVSAGKMRPSGVDVPHGGWEWSLPAWCEGEKPCVFPQDSNILVQLTDALRLSCVVDERPARGEVASTVPDAELVARQDVVSAASNNEQPPGIPEDSKNSKVREALADGGQDAAAIERPTVAREGGIGSPKRKMNAVAPGRIR